MMKLLLLIAILTLNEFIVQFLYLAMPICSCVVRRCYDDSHDKVFAIIDAFEALIPNETQSFNKSSKTKSKQRF